MQGDGRQGAFVVSQTGLHIGVGPVDLHGLGSSRQVDHTLSQDHLTKMTGNDFYKNDSELKYNVSLAG